MVHFVFPIGNSWAESEFPAERVVYPRRIVLVNDVDMADEKAISLSEDVEDGYSAGKSMVCEKSQQHGA